MKQLAKILSCLLVFMATIIPVCAIDIPPSTDAYYLDEANVLSQETKNYISEKNHELDQYCGAYVEIVTEKYIHADVADYTYKIQNDWKISDNGFTLVLVTEEEKYYLMWGREIEKKFEPYVFQNILDTYFEQDFDKGNYDQAVRNTYDAIYKELVKVYGSPNQTKKSDENSFLSTLIGIIIFIIFMVVIVRVLFAPMVTPFGFFRRRSRRHYYHSSRPRHFSSGGYSFGGTRRSSSGGHSFGSRSSGGRSHGSGGRGAGVGRR